MPPSTVSQFATTEALGLVARIARRQSGIYYLIPRANADFNIDADANWDPHASYHSDGCRHVKSFNQVAGSRTKLQPLLGFTGAEQLFDQSFMPGDLGQTPLLPQNARFAHLFEIPTTLLDPRAQYAISVSLLSPGAAPVQGPWLKHVLACSFEDALPWVHVALWQGLHGTGDV